MGEFEDEMKRLGLESMRREFIDWRVTAIQNAQTLFKRMEKRHNDRQVWLDQAVANIGFASRAGWLDGTDQAWTPIDVGEVIKKLKPIDLMQRADGTYTSKPPENSSSISWDSMVESILRVKAITSGMPKRIFVNPKYKQPLLEMCTVQEPQPMDKTTLMGLEIVFDPGVAEYRVEYVDDPPPACED